MGESESETDTDAAPEHEDPDLAEFWGEDRAKSAGNDATTNGESFGHRWRRRARWVFWRRLPFGGLVGALVFFCLSLTPSLLPRAVFLQGAVSGITAVIGYGLGCAGSAILRKFVSEPSARAKRIAWSSLLGVSVALVSLFLYLGAQWQKTVRELMEMDALEDWKWVAILVIAAIVGYLVLFSSRLVRGFTRVVIRFLDRYIPRVAAVTGGIVIAAFVVIGFLQGFLFNLTIDALNSTFAVVNRGTTEGITQPDEAERSGNSFGLCTSDTETMCTWVEWDSLGVKGRDFIGHAPDNQPDDLAQGGPSRAEFAAFTGEAATEPIRIYVGLESAGSADERVALAMSELDRTDAWSRDFLNVFTTTGTGWVDAKIVDGLEYMHGGNTAIVALQYSYLPSWISFLVDQEKASEAGELMIGAVTERLATLPEGERPKLLVSGESLGSFGTESAFENFDDMAAKVDGALLIGPVFVNSIHEELTDGRDDGSPVWRPVFGEGGTVRFAVEPADLAEPDTPWDTETRVVYLQNSSDPITWWSPELLWSPPDWLDDPTGPDISPDMFWMPVISFWQTAADMAFSTGVPPGHGHKYGANPVDAWVEITQPDGWTDDDTQRLREIIGHD